MSEFEFSITKATLDVVSDREVLMKKLFWNCFKQVLEREGWDGVKVLVLLNQSKPTYRDRKTRLDDATNKLFELMKRNQGLTQKQLALKFYETYGFHCTTYGNKLRKLRKEGKVRSIVGSDKLLHWFTLKGLET